MTIEQNITQEKYTPLTFIRNAGANGLWEAWKMDKELTDETDSYLAHAYREGKKLSQDLVNRLGELDSPFKSDSVSDRIARGFCYAPIGLAITMGYFYGALFSPITYKGKKAEETQ